MTARKTIIDDLGLEYIQHVDSYGIHTTVKMPIYKGILRLGDSDWLNVEVSNFLFFRCHRASSF